jgi:hypothetical protein
MLENLFLAQASARRYLAKAYVVGVSVQQSVQDLIPKGFLGIRQVDIVYLIMLAQGRIDATVGTGPCFLLILLPF